MIVRTKQTAGLCIRKFWSNGGGHYSFSCQITPLQWENMSRLNVIPLDTLMRFWHGIHYIHLINEHFFKAFWSAQFVLIYAYSRYLGYSTPASSAMTNAFFTLRKALLSTGLDSKVFLEWRHLKDILIRWHHAEGINLSRDFLYCNKEKDF